jgi:hypothetical protein
MVFVYGEARGNASRAAALYRGRFPTGQVPDARLFPAVLPASSCGSFRMHTADMGPTQTDRRLQPEEDELELVAATPGISTRRLAIQQGLSQSMVWRTLHEQGLYPYHVQRVHPKIFPGE